MSKFISAFTVAAIAGSAFAGSTLRVTELSTKSATDPEDYFELTNFGAAPFDLTGWQFDDESADIGDAVAITGPNKSHRELSGRFSWSSNEDGCSLLTHTRDCVLCRVSRDSNREAQQQKA